eukprot:Gb_11298 [translate_table: standard]
MFDCKQPTWVLNSGIKAVGPATMDIAESSVLLLCVVNVGELNQRVSARSTDKKKKEGENIWEPDCSLKQGSYKKEGESGAFVLLPSNAKNPANLSVPRSNGVLPKLASSLVSTGQVSKLELAKHTIDALDEMPTRTSLAPPNLDEQKRLSVVFSNIQTIGEIKVIFGIPEQYQVGFMLEDVGIFDNRQNSDANMNGHWDFKNKAMIRATKIKSWTLVNLSPRISPTKAKYVAYEFQQSQDKRGLVMNAYGIVLKEPLDGRYFIPINHLPTIEDIGLKCFPTLPPDRGKQCIMELESTYLDQFEASNVVESSKVKAQKLFSKLKRIVEKCPVDKCPIDNMGCLNGGPIDEPLDVEIEPVLGFLKHRMLGTPVASLRKIYLERGLGDAIVGGGIENKLV